MTVDEFLTRHLDGFLLDDLETMAALPADGERGTLGVPMVLNVFAGCELLGGLLSPGTCRTAFVTYWVDRLYPGADRAGAEALYRLVRDGVGHAFIATPGLRVTRSRDPRHLTHDGDIYIIDALTLHDDFRASYATVRREMVERGQPALFELIAWYENVSGELFRHLPGIPDPAVATAVTAAVAAAAMESEMVPATTIEADVVPATFEAVAAFPVLVTPNEPPEASALFVDPVVGAVAVPGRVDGSAA
jgi:hypothetical protein